VSAWDFSKYQMEFIWYLSSEKDNKVKNVILQLNNCEILVTDAINHEYKGNTARMSYQEWRKCYYGKHEFMPINEMALATFERGYIAYKTGAYPDNIDNTNFKHIGFESEEVAEKALKDKSLLDLNSAIVLQNNKNDYFSHLSVKDNGSYFNHVYNEEAGKVYYDGTQSYSKYIESSYNKYKEDRKDLEYKPTEKYLLSIQTEEDLQAFENDVNRYEKEGILSGINSLLVDECRWCGRCTIHMMCRGIIQSDDTIRPCLTCEKNIGSWKKSSYERKQLADRQAVSSVLERECSKCQAYTYCSKCSMLPSDISSKRFCSIVKEHPLIMDFLMKREYLGALYQFSDMLKKVGIPFRISTPFAPLVYQRKDLVTVAYNKLINLFTLKGKYYVCHLRRNSILEIPEMLAFIMEGYSMNLDNKEIADALVERFEIEAERGEAVVNEGMNTVKEAGII
jgi:hypothetical protein